MPEKNIQETCESAMQKIAELIQKKEYVIISIDGRCGSGKSSLAEILGRKYDCNIMHMDDFYLPMEKRQENWWEIPGGNMDFERFHEEIGKFLVQHDTIWYRPYDCMHDRFRQTQVMPAKQLNVIEGSYSQHPLVRLPYDLKIFMTCSSEEQLKRLKMREGDHFERFVKRWIPMEELYYKAYGIDHAEQSLQIRMD